MIQSIKRGHTYFFVFLSVFLPLVAVLALYFKVGLKILQKKLSVTVLLGKLVGDTTQMFTIDANIVKKFKFLVLYSKPFSKVIKEMRFNLKG